VIINAWLEIKDTFTWPAENSEDDTELQAKNRQTLERCGDIQVIPGLYKTRTLGPRSWQLYSLLYDVQSIPEFEQAIELFKSENPGDTDVLGAWHWETGNQVTDDNVPLYPIPGGLSNFMPDDPDGTPNNTQRDINLYFGQTPRDFS